MNSKKLIMWIRWIILLPVSLLLGFLSLFPFHLLLLLLTSLWDNENYEIGSAHFFLSLLKIDNLIALEFYLSPLIIAGAFIWSGYKVAPSNKLLTTKALFIIYVATQAVIVMLTILKIIPNLIIDFRILSGTIGATIALVSIYQNEKSNINNTSWR